MVKQIREMLVNKTFKCHKYPINSIQHFTTRNSQLSPYQVLTLTKAVERIHKSLILDLIYQNEQFETIH